MDHETFARLCLDPARLAALGRAAEGELTVDGLAGALGLGRRQALEVVAGLRSAGLVDERGRLDRATLRDIAQASPGQIEPSPEILEGEWSQEELRVLRTFFVGDRLVKIPTNRAKRRVVLERCAREFDPGVRYQEAEVSQRLAEFHPDYAALRRYLVDEGILSRERGTYWRCGGRLSLDALDDPESMDELPPSPRLVLATERHDVTLISTDATTPQVLAAAANDEQISRFMTDAFPHPYTIDDASDWLGKVRDDDPLLNFAVMVDGKLAGGVGCEPKGDIATGSAEIGWWLNPAWWDRGIATAAVRRFIDYCFTELDLHRVEAGVFVTNPASAGVAERAGMILEGVSRDAYLKAGAIIDRLSYGRARSSVQPPVDGR